mmetsp:Transcript_151183/g.384244  ORF Transcript_151183/g.384244 Transcript_151183/m.384244 type:complete len:223 (+) Transcript_151183:703-1371(+)
MSRPNSAWGTCLQNSYSKPAPAISSTSPVSELLALPTMISSADICTNPTPRSLRYSMSALNMSNAASTDFGRARTKRTHKARRLSPPRNCSTSARSSGLVSTRCCSRAAASASAHVTERKVLSSSSSAPWVNSSSWHKGASIATLVSGSACLWIAAVPASTAEVASGFWSSAPSSQIGICSTASSPKIVLPGCTSTLTGVLSASVFEQAQDAQANHIAWATS